MKFFSILQIPSSAVEMPEDCPVMQLSGLKFGTDGFEFLPAQPEPPCFEEPQAEEEPQPQEVGLVVIIVLVVFVVLLLLRV